MKTVGLLRVKTTPGFRREFTPNFIKSLSGSKNVKVLVENYYGSDLGFKKKDYLVDRHITFYHRRTILKKSQIVLVRASPQLDDVNIMKPGQIFVSKFHFLTHPSRNALLNKKGIVAISLDELKDSEGKRLVEDFMSVAYNGITAGFIELRKRLGDNYWFNNRRGPIIVYQIGFGAVGKYATEAAFKMGNTNFVEELEDKGGNPIVEVIPTNSIHSKHNFLIGKIISKSLTHNGRPHLIVDATNRKDTSQTLVPEHILKLLPPETVIVDISADVYENKTVVKAIQGIPTGNDSKYIFYPRDKDWSEQAMVPKRFQLDRSSRRVVVSHYAWSSYGNNQDRIKNMEKQGRQILPVIDVLLKMNLKNYENYNSKNWTFEKAVYQSSLEYFLKSMS